MGAPCDLVGVFLVVLIVGRFQHPLGIGAEKMMGPLLGLNALCLFAPRAGCFFVSSRIKLRPEGQ
jgi:hypothetical protein